MQETGIKLDRKSTGENEVLNCKTNWTNMKDSILQTVLAVFVCTLYIHKSIQQEAGDAANVLVERMTDDVCELSTEAVKVKLTHLLSKIKKGYYEVNRHMASTNFEFSDKEVKQYYTPYLPSPDNLKKNADTAKTLLKSLKNLKVNDKLLKPREERVIYQYENFLQSNFDNIYSNYYDGVYMLGPDYFCEQTMCYVTQSLQAALTRITVKSLKDLELILFWIKQHKNTFEQYQDNMKEGVKQGMVNPIEVCRASSKTFAKKFAKVYYKGADGALEMKFAKNLIAKSYYKDVSNVTFSNFERKHGQKFHDMLQETIKEDFGKPLSKLIQYLRHEHIHHCVSSNISSGLGGLPLDYQYVNDTKQEGTETPKKLPSGEDIDVAYGYRKFMRYYTTSNTNGTEAMKLGYKLVEKYYDEVLSLGRDITQIKDDDEEMKTRFQKILKLQKQFYNKEEFPSNESDDDAHDNCDNDFDAERNCPQRWKVLQKWFEANVKIMKEAKSSFKHLFYQDGPRKTTPDCLVSLVPEYNPTNGVPSYLESDPECTEPASYFLPFFKNDMGPKYEDYNTNFHEARPGHHLQIQGYLENFADTCGGVTSWINEIVDYYPSFSEGWGLYAENPILLNDTNVLSEDDKIERYGVLKWQIWRALRLIVDVGMHEKNMSRQEALNLFSKYAWDDSDTTSKELTRYQGTPGQATSYTSGQQTIISLRKRAQQELGNKFNIKDFHYQILSQGQSPFFFISKYIDEYIKCTQNKKNGKYCHIILSKSSTGQKKKRTFISEKEKDVTHLFKLFKKRKYS